MAGGYWRISEQNTGKLLNVGIELKKPYENFQVIVESGEPVAIIPPEKCILLDYKNFAEGKITDPDGNIARVCAPVWLYDAGYSQDDGGYLYKGEGTVTTQAYGATPCTINCIIYLDYLSIMGKPDGIYSVGAVSFEVYTTGGGSNN